MSDFLQFRNELIDGQPKYFVTDNADGTKNIALANPIIERGTPLNKVGLQTINSIMGYNYCEVEKEQVIVPSEYYKLNYENVNQTWASGDSISNPIIFELSTINDEFLGTYTPTCTLTDSNNYNFKATNSPSSTAIGLYTKNGSSTQYYTSSQLLSTLNSFQISSNYGTTFVQENLPVNEHIIFKYDFKQNETNKKLYIGFNGGSASYTKAKVYVSNNDIDYTLNSEISASFSAYKEEIIDIENYQYAKIEFNTTAVNLLQVVHMYAEIQTYSTKYKNNLIAPNTTESFTNNQMIYIETPNDLDLIDVVANTLNDIEISVVLQPNKKYKLIYNEDIHKFELGGEKILLDLTLEEPAKIITYNLKQYLEENKIYQIMIYSKPVSNDSPLTIAFGNYNEGYMAIGSAESNEWTFNICYFTIRNNICYATHTTPNQFTNKNKSLDEFDIDKIEFHINRNINTEAGTRIIIKEVA